ncbi:fe2+ transport protein [Halorubellus sp. JP-L1]|uniref:DUF7350 domain-containing protein n=1 Tax=Halorubellus sp. JP-L1 TaxID=2715753 RepID=UPI00140A27CD|nr:fe2+ transport protein [Halorubellus sp. JP-L1]NHN41064.1 fe2+ transport protein [Halorubellus sp. JP-L1]
MERRRLLQSLPAVAGVGLAGCLDSGGGGTETTATDGDEPTETSESTTATPDGPTGIYVQTFMDKMVSSGMGKAGDLRAMLMLSIPHDFWNINGTSVEKTAATDADSFHLMATVFDAATNTVLPASVSTEVLRDGETVTQEVTYPMLSQRMGFHYGANFEVSSFGSYVARVNFEGLGSTRGVGDLEGAYGEGVTVEIPFEWTQSVADQFSVRDVDAGGKAGAVRPMGSMDAPMGELPAPDALPGSVVGSKLSDGANLVAGRVDGGGRFADGSDYLYVSARTRYNGYVVPMMGLEATVTRDGETVFDDRLAPAIDGEMGYHYGAAVDAVESGDAVDVRATTPAQVARHEGYERAFRQLRAVSFEA